MRVALVTGGGQGIDKAIARRLLQDGMGVVIAGCDVEAGRETAEEYAARGPLAFVARRTSPRRRRCKPRCARP